MIKVTMPNGTIIEGETKDDLKQIFSFLDSNSENDEESKDEKPILTLPPLTFKVYCAISDFPGSHSGQIANILQIKSGQVSTAINDLKRHELVQRRQDGHWGWLLTPKANEIQVMGQGELTNGCN